MADWKGYSRNANIGKLNEALEANYDSIVLMVEILPLLRARLIAKKLFSSDRLKEVLADCKSEKEKTLAVLDRLPRTKEALYTFVDIIKEDYEHVAGPLERDLDTACACAGPSLQLPVPVSESDDKKLVEHSQPDSASDDTEVKVPHTAPCQDGLVSVHPTELQRMISTQLQQFSAEQKKIQEQENQNLWSEVHMLKSEKKIQEQKNQNLWSEVHKLKSEKKTQEQENQKLWSEVHKLKKENVEGKMKVNEASKMIQELQGECAALKGECAKYKETISQQATTINRQQKEICTEKEKICRHEDTITRQNNRISQLEADRVLLYQYQNSCCARTFPCFFPREADNDYIKVPTNANERTDNNNQ